MANLIAFRPRMGIEKIKSLSKKMDYPNVSRFIEDAILEKIQREIRSEKSSDLQKLNDEIGNLIMKHLGIRSMDPNSKRGRQRPQASEAARTGKVKSDRWKGSLEQLLNDAKRHRYAKPEEK